MISNKYNKGSLAIGQIGILVIATFAFAFLVGGMELVSGSGKSKSSSTTYEWQTDDQEEELKVEPWMSAKNLGSTVLTTTITDITKRKAKDLLKGKGFGGSIKEIFSISSVEKTGEGIVVAKNPSLLYLGMGLVWAGILGLSARYIGSASGLSVENAQNLAKSVFVGSTLVTTLTKAGAFKFLAGVSVGWVAVIGGAVGGAVYAAFIHKTYSQEIVTYECNVWQAPLGGENCELCNNEDVECTEYQCKSLGQACNIVNEGTDEQMCVWLTKNDVSPPIIEPLDDALLGGYKYDPDNTVSPPDEGVEVVNTESSDGCAPAFTPISFGVETDEPSRCKIDIENKRTFEEMLTYMDGVNLKYTHEFALSLPSKSSLDAENITLENGGNFEAYIRCEDANGNVQVGNFVFKYCVDQGPDVTAPLIISTSVLDDYPIAYNTSSFNLDIYVNEPTECKWSHLDLDFDSMENEMVCADKQSQASAGFLYKCKTTLTGLKDRVDNNVYIRCKDQPHLEGTDEESQRNENEESYELTLKGTQPLVIDSVSPNDEIIKDSTDSMKVTLEVETSAGYDKGKAVCSYYQADENYEPMSGKNYIEFFYGYDVEAYSQYNHIQDIWLSEGDYNYEIKCCDLGNNCDYEMINFSVETDTTAPIVVRAFHEDTYLKIITDEEAQCVYDTKDCSYSVEDGIEMTDLNEGLEHYTSWNSKKNYYIKCFDEYGNQPNPDECSIIAKPFEVSKIY